ncbi:MAG TPA: bacillithiol system redox-active protein YtxJ [Flavobacteriia bacterium]|nr:bacillithiol system redox-active protein YtxJ [Flavobacteriia bacterium]
MGLKKILFGNTNEKPSKFNWKELETIEQLDTIEKESYSKPVLIFKHSTRCGISRSVLKAFEKQFKDLHADFYYLDLLNHRDISNEIASRYNVVHQSPQLLILKDGKVVKHDSHYNLLELKAAIE